MVEPENYNQLADAIIDLLVDEKKRLEYGQAGYDQVRKTCNSKTMANSTLRLYQKILADN